MRGNIGPWSFRVTGALRRTLWLVLAMVFWSSFGADTGATTSFKFTFGAAKPPSGWLQVTPATTYIPARGYGFEPGSEIVQRNNGCRSDRPFLFSVALPEGNYTVSVTLGDDDTGSTNTVKAESRRLMLERVVTTPGQFETRTFTVNIRTPELSGGGSVRLKEREKGVLHWDEKLTLEFNGARPTLRSLEIAPATNAITVFLLGDSTVTDQPLEPWNSWGQMLPRFFTAKVAVANHAESGESLKSSLGARRVAKVLASLKAGDFVFVQFGHNDQKDRATNALAVFQANLTKLVADVCARGGTPVLVTSMERMSGLEHDTLGDYPAAVQKVAEANGTALIDLHALSRILYRALGPNLKRAFQDGTHLNAYGSYELAKCIVLGIRQNHLSLAQWLSDDVPEFDPAHPDAVDAFDIPPSVVISQIKPDGN